MDIKQDYQPTIPVKPRKSLFTVFIDILSFFLIPVKFLGKQLNLIKEDNAKRSRWLAWHKRENGRHRRGIKLNDEF